MEKIRDILTQTEDQMKTIRSLGIKGIDEIKYSLAQYGLSLKK
jgi:DNA-directed RNA polymerase alpha subunit